MTTGYLVAPDSGTGRAVLVLSSWWGLNRSIEATCETLADHGFVALAPDLVGDGRTTTDAAEAQRWLEEADPNQVADLVLSSAALLRSTEITPDAPIGVLGLSMGASWALWMASRAPETVAAVSFFYGSQDVDRLDVTAAVQGHFAEHDDFVSRDDRVLLEASLNLDGTDVECFDYPGTAAWFFEEGPNHDPGAAALAWERVVAFFDAKLPR